MRAVTAIAGRLLPPFSPKAAALVHARLFALRSPDGKPVAPIPRTQLAVDREVREDRPYDARKCHAAQKTKKNYEGAHRLLPYPHIMTSLTVPLQRCAARPQPRGGRDLCLGQGRSSFREGENARPWAGEIEFRHSRNNVALVHLLVVRRGNEDGGGG